MLLQFSTQNHRSLRDKQTLSMVASTDRADDERLIPCPAIHGAVLPVAALYGANASGKSNVLDAMRYMRDAVLNSHRDWTPGEPVPWWPFMLSDVIPATTTYEMNFIASGTRCRYGFAISVGRFEEEWLHTWPNGKKQVWLERRKDEFHFGKKLSGENDVIRKLTRPNSLFLSAAAQNNHPALIAVHSFFREPNFVQRGPGSTGLHRPEFASWFREFDDRKASIITHLLAAADTGVRGFSFGQTSDGRVTLNLLHKGIGAKGQPLPLESESDGTLALLHLGIRLFDVLAAGGLFVIDELEASLHPSLARSIVQLFQDPKQNPKHAQLVFTTHDTNLLGSIAGDPILRRDQVWLTEKDNEGATKLYALTDFRPRKQENLERGYLQGRYGAVPFLGALVPDESKRTES